MTARTRAKSELTLARDGACRPGPGRSRRCSPGGIVGKEELEALARVIESKNLFRYYGVGDGPDEVFSFEREFAEHMGSKHALCVNAGSSALVCAHTRLRRCLLALRRRARRGLGRTAGARLPDAHTVRRPRQRRRDDSLRARRHRRHARVAESSFGHDIRCEVVGSEGSVFVRGPGDGTADVIGRSDAGRFPADYRARFADAYVAELAAFVAACTGSGPPGPTLDDDRRAVATGISARASAIAGKPLAVGTDWPWP
jgi:hypothetical protein